MNDYVTTPSQQPIDCLKCRYFQITWEAEHPRACRAMGFKTAIWPWQEVLRTSGEPCLQFEAKTTFGKNGQKKSNNTSFVSDRFSRIV